MVEVQKREVWKNPGKGDVYINKFSYDGKIISELVQPGGKIQLTFEERRMNEDAAYSEPQNLFKNGVLQPVVLIDDVPDYEEVASNPALISEQDTKDLFKLAAPAFKKKIREISNVLVLDRLAELADDENINASVPQVKAIEARIEEVDPHRGEVVSLGDYADDKPIPEVRLS